MQDIARICANVDDSRLWQRHQNLAAIGATAKGGVNRQALTAEDIQSRRLLVDWAIALGFSVFIDEIGNMFIRRRGRNNSAAPVLTGSHIDTQPTGGRFDGIYGVLAGCEALEAIESVGVTTEHPLEVAIWTNEEGSRFPPGCMGSSVFANPKRLPEMLAVSDQEGVSVASALRALREAFPDVQPRSFGWPVKAFVEAHIEQGSQLEMAECTIGVVTGIQGLLRFDVDIEGEEGHAGTLPRTKRKDALSTFVALVSALELQTQDNTDTTRFTVGRAVIYPNAPAVVPGRVCFTIDLRHPDAEVLKMLGERIRSECARFTQRCRVSVSQTAYFSPVHFDALVPNAVTAAVVRQNLPSMRIVSGAVHDAQHLHRICPAGMIFVPSERGISHNEAESSSPQDLAAGTRVLTEVLVALAKPAE